MPVQIRETRVENLLDLRHAELRAGLPRDTAKLAGDHDPSAVHFGAFDGDRAVGCALMLQRPWITGEAAWQLRGMAVAKSHQKMGVGLLLLQAVENRVRTEEYSKILWCNGRKTAVAFYQKYGMEKSGEEFEIPLTGPHFKMIKRM